MKAKFTLRIEENKLKEMKISAIKKWYALKRIDRKIIWFICKKQKMITKKFKYSITLGNYCRMSQLYNKH